MPVNTYNEGLVAESVKRLADAAVKYTIDTQPVILHHFVRTDGVGMTHSDETFRETIRAAAVVVCGSDHPGTSAAAADFLTAHFRALTPAAK
jgi:hypothetical protein